MRHAGQKISILMNIINRKKQTLGRKETILVILVQEVKRSCKITGWSQKIKFIPGIRIYQQTKSLTN